MKIEAEIIGKSTAYNPLDISSEVSPIVDINKGVDKAPPLISKKDQLVKQPKKTPTKKVKKPENKLKPTKIIDEGNG